MNSEAPHVAIHSSPGMGHLIPIVELAKRLVLRHHLTVTLITYSNLSSPSQHAILSSLPADIASLTIPNVPLHDLPVSAHAVTRIAVLISRAVPHVASTLRSFNSTTPLSAFIVDIFGGDNLSSAHELGIPGFLFSTSSFLFLSIMLHLPDLDATTDVEYRDLLEPLTLSGCVLIRGEELFEPMQDRKDDAYRWLVHLAERFLEADGIFVNSFHELEPAAAEVLAAGSPPAYPVGPLIRAGRDGQSECLDWLDKQPSGSVLFVSFGSGGTLSTLQMRELAAGLELSGQRFLWVVRKPNDRETSGVFFGAGEGEADVFSYLPDGFVERTREVGKAVAMWAPQVEVLGHAATGGFISHCGWNSTMESMVAGVPMIAWPLYAEQRANEVMLAEGVGVALRVLWEDAVVGREEVARVVKELMVGEAGRRVRKSVAEMQVAVGEDGSSVMALEEVVSRWKDTIKHVSHLANVSYARSTHKI